MRIYVDDIENGFFKLGKQVEVVASESMCRETSLPNPKRTLIGKLFNKDIKKCIPYLYIEVERQMPLGNLRLTMHPTILVELQKIMRGRR